MREWDDREMKVYWLNHGKIYDIILMTIVFLGKYVHNWYKETLWNVFSNDMAVRNIGFVKSYHFNFAEDLFIL